MAFSTLAQAGTHIRSAVESLAASPHDPATISDAEQIVASTADIFWTPQVQAAPANFLELVADLVSSAANLKQISTNFAQVVLATWTKPEYFPLFVEATAKGDTYCVPHWWPPKSHSWSSAEVALASFWPAVSCFNTAAHAELQLVTEWAELAVKVMAAVSALAQVNKSARALDPYRTLLEIMSESQAHRDLAALIIYQMPNGIQSIKEASSGTHSMSVARSAKLVLDMVMHRAAWLTICSHLLRLPEAHVIWQKYSTEQQDALQLACKTPFRFVVDLLNQGRNFKIAGDSMIIPCVNVAAASMELQSRIPASKRDMYADFNRHCHTDNLVSVLCDLGYLVSYNLLSWGGQDMLIVSPVKHVFPGSTLPPIQKPDHFLAKAEFGCKDETLNMIQRIDAFGDMELSIVLILKCILNVMDDEMTARAVATPANVTWKLITHAVEHVFGLLVVATSCSLRHDRETNPAATIPLICSEITEKIIALAETEPSIWITLFNFANDACYADLRLVKVFEEIFDRVLSHGVIVDNADLVKCGISLFVATFSVDVQDRSGITKYCDLKPGDSQLVEVPQSEYKFLYQSANFRRANSDVESVKSAPVTAMPTASRLKSYSRGR